MKGSRLSFSYFAAFLFSAKETANAIYIEARNQPIWKESPWNVLKIYVSKALCLLNKNLEILGAPKQRNCILPTSKVCL